MPPKKSSRRREMPRSLAPARSSPAQAVVSGQSVSGFSANDGSDNESLAESIASLATIGQDGKNREEAREERGGFRKLKEHAESLTKKSETQDNVLASIRAKLAERDIQLAAAAEASNNQKQRIEELESHQCDSKRIGELEQEVLAMKEALELATRGQESVQLELKDKTRTLQHTRDELEAVKMQQKAQDAEILTKDESDATLQSALDEAKRTLTDKETQLADAERALQSIQATTPLASIETTIDTLRSDLADSQSAFSESQRNFAEQMAAIVTQHQQDIEGVSRSSQKQLDEAYAALEHEREAREAIGKQVASLEAQLGNASGYEKRFKDAELELSAAQKVVASLTDLTSTLERQRSAFEDELVELRTATEHSRNTRSIPINEVLSQLGVEGDYVRSLLTDRPRTAPCSPQCAVHLIRARARRL